MTIRKDGKVVGDSYLPCIPHEIPHQALEVVTPVRLSSQSKTVGALAASLPTDVSTETLILQQLLYFIG